MFWSSKRFKCDEWRSFKIFIIYFILSIIYFIKPIWNNNLFAAGDALNEFFPLRYFYKYEFLKNGLSLWIPYFFLGLPYIGILQSGVFYPLNFIYFILPLPYAFNISQLLHFSLASFFLYIYLKKIGLKDYPSFLGGLIFGFSGFLMAHKGHISIVNSAIWFPLILYFFEKLKENIKIKWSITLGLLMGIQIFAGHFQTFFYSSLFFVAYIFFIFFNLKEKRNKFLLYSFLSFLFSLIFSLPQFLSTLELTFYSVRRKMSYLDFVYGSFPPYFLIHSIFPYIFGGGYDDGYWGPLNLTEYGMFVGSFPLFLSIYIFKKLKKNPYILFFFIFLPISLFLAFGKYNPFYKFFYYIPFYNLFKFCARHMMEFDLSVAVLFAFGLNFLIYDKNFREENLFKILKFFLLIFALILIFFLIIRIFIGDNREFWIPFFTDEGKKILLKSLSFKNKAILIPSLFTILYIFSLLFLKFKIDVKIFKSAFFTVIFLECFSFGYFYESTAWKVKIKDIPENIEGSNKYFFHYLKNDNEIFRALILEEEPFSLFNIFEKISFLNGYDPFAIRDFQILLDIAPWGKAEEELIINNLLISSLNVKYVIVKKDLKEKIEKITYLDSLEKRLIFEISKNERVFLRVEKKGKAGMIEKKIKTKPNTYYLISTEIRGNANAQFVIDLYNWEPFYDYPEQELWINSFEIPRDSFITFFKIINTGENPPDEVYLRIFTYSTNPVEIKNLKVEEVDRYFPFSLKYSKSDKVYRKVNEWEDYALYENENYLPRTFFVGGIKPVRNIEEIKKAFYFHEFNPYRTALIFKKEYEELKSKKFSIGNAKIKKYKTDKIIIETENEGEGFLVFSEQYYPGWKAFIDGKETKIYRVNGIIKGIVVPPGKHKIIFRYKPMSFYISTVISFIFLILCILYLIKPV